MKKQILSLAVLGLALCGVARADDPMLINGVGGTFPQPIYTKWFNAYLQVDPSVRINYQGTGSGNGQKAILAMTADFGASDGPMSDAMLKSASSELWHLPTVAGAVVISYNLPNDPTIKLDGPTLANIFLGKITKWNDPAITGQNAGLSLPDEDIVVVHRAEASGTTYCFTDYLSSVSPEWKTGPGKGTGVSWPTGFGAKGNPGVAGQIKQSPGAIGYIELAYAQENKLPFAQMKNSAGNYITASIESVKQALATANIPDDFRFSMVNPPGDQAYPIATTTWLLVYAQQKDHAKGEKIVQFLKWAYTEGEKMAPTLSYAPLPDNVLSRVMDRVNSIKY